MSWGKQTGRTNPLYPSLRISLLVLFDCFFGSVAAQAIDADVLVTEPGLPFAIADFDSDLRPDVAVIQPVSNRSSVTSYRIQLQFNAGGRRSIYMAGPSGGLQLAARDVNGDGIPDLIVSAIWRAEPLAILLNDGRGAFSWANPSSFPRTSVKSHKPLICELPRLTDTVATLPQSFVPDFSGTTYLLHPRLAARFVPRANLASLLSSLLVSLPGRAPPKASRL